MKTIKNVADVKSLDIIAAFKQAKKVYYDTVEEVCGSITAYNTPKQSNKIDEALKKYDKKFYINNRQFHVRLLLYSPNVIKSFYIM